MFLRSMSNCFKGYGIFSNGSNELRSFPSGTKRWRIKFHYLLCMINFKLYELIKFSNGYFLFTCEYYRPFFILCDFCNFLCLLCSLVIVRVRIGWKVLYLTTESNCWGFKKPMSHASLDSYFLAVTFKTFLLLLFTFFLCEKPQVSSSFCLHS